MEVCADNLLPDVFLKLHHYTPSPLHLRSKPLSNVHSYLFSTRTAAPLFTIHHFAERLAFLVAFADIGDGIAERNDCHNFDVVGNAWHGIDLLEIVESDPV